MKRTIICLLILTLITSLSVSAEEGCENCETHPNKECCDMMQWLPICGPGDPGGDAADDNYSFSNISLYNLSEKGRGTLSVLYRGFWKSSESLPRNFCENINLHKSL